MTGVATTVAPRPLRLAGSLLGWLAVAAVVAALWPARWGGFSSLTVVSGSSMEPTLRSGDLVIGWRTGDYDAGDVVVFRVPDGEPGEGHQVVHRVVADDGGAFTTKGDNKRIEDPWRPAEPDVVGRAMFVVPNGARLLRAIPMALAVLAGALVTVALWPSRAPLEGRG